MVNNTYKNGMLDVIGAVCAVYVILLICKQLVAVKWLAAILAFYGRNTLIFLCFHLIELNMFPWYRVVEYLDNRGIDGGMSTIIVCLAKVAWVTFWILFVKRIPIMRKVFSVSKPA